MRSAFCIGWLALLVIGAAGTTWAAPENATRISPADQATAPEMPAIPGAARSVLTESLQAFDQWANQQDYYPSSTLVAMRARLAETLASLPAAEAATFRDQLIAKLDILQDPQWQNVEQWLVQTLAVASDSHATTIQKMLPDIVADSPGEMRAKLRIIAIRAINLQQVRQGFEQARQASIRVAREHEGRQAQINAQVRASMTYSTPNLYSPAAQSRSTPSQRHDNYFNQRYGSPFSYGLGGVWFF